MKFTKWDKRSNLEKEINSVLAIMATWEPSSPEYTAMTKNLEVLYKARNEEKTRKIKPDTVLVVAANLLGIILILGYEETNIIRSKAMSFVLKGRV